MLSVLIPVFNYDVRQLVSDLASQLNALSIEYEIRVYDDCSTKEALKSVNDPIEAFPGVVYKKLTKNLGFCRIRNLLAEEAQFELLLFLDSDVSVQDGQFIERYLQVADEQTVFCGGMQYVEEQPPEAYYLKWKHGKEREEAPADQRNFHPHRTLWAGNFLIPKSIYLAARFDDDSTGYGYNDTMFGYKLRVQKVPVVHIDNPLWHKGLMPAEKFLRRSMEAVENLMFFEKRDYIEPSFYTFIKVLKYYRLLKRFGLAKGFYKFYLGKKSAWEQNLLSSNPNLRNLDKLKLGKLIELRSL
jgi:glycosyltransferase involved in cell wall biosynthesis